jgi:hypothetical protein
VRREDIPPLLYQATDRLPEPDLADAAWEGGVAIRRRRRRSAFVSVLAVLLVGVVAVIVAAAGSGSNSGLVPPTTPPTNPEDYVAPAGKIAGIDYWVAPPPGSERFLDRLETPLGDKLQMPAKVRRLADHPLERLAAVVLTKHGSYYRPLLLGSDGSWSLADVGLVAIATGAPLSLGAISPDAAIAAFPQPGELVVVDAATTQIVHFPLPTNDIRSVSWLADAQYVLVSGPGVTYRVLVSGGSPGEVPVVRISGVGDPEAATAPFRLQTGSVMRYLDSGQWAEDSTLSLPVRAWVGPTFSSNSMAARLFIANDIPQIPTHVSQLQVVAAISTLRSVPSRLLVLGEPLPGPARTPEADHAYVREPGCCAVLGWYDEGTALLEVRGWVLAWDLYSGRVRRVTELAVGGLAVGPGLRP